jgi:hypothetical protein
LEGDLTLSELHPAPDANDVLLTPADLIVDQALGPDDPDTLEHRPIAERVADLVSVSTTPLNIALFGAWGSGKSSFAQLLRECLNNRYPKSKLVTYNAWTFEGESLERSFISGAATQLDMGEGETRNIEFHGGLYEHRRSARLNLDRADIAKLLLIAAGFFAGALVFLFLLVMGIAMIVGTDPVRSAIDALPSLIPATAVAGIVASAAREIVAGARVDVDSSAPTQEQFRTTFRHLIERGAHGKEDRLVFFIDELDRCSPDQVVKVLASVRHFFDQPSCVFVIAADRDVIEQALAEKVEQATPLNLEIPYYSSASEYIDKVFQHQVALPPLRGRRLTRFARDLIESPTTGLWAELAAVDDGRLRDQLTYLLIPSHVRSPRRVKVLLNNFATNARIAQSRGLNIVKNAPALAKLTALRTEFPLFAADLQSEPRLPKLLLEEPANPSPRVAQLLARHRLPTSNEPVSGSAASAERGAEAAAGASGIVASGKVAGELQPTDAVLTKTDKAGRQMLSLSERTLLRRYLVRTNQFPNPPRDLLYLEPAGAAVNLADEAFAELLESAAIEAPEEVVNATAEQPPEEQRKALGVLTDMASQEFGPERTNVVSALLGVAGHLDYNVARYGSDVLGALKVQRNEGGFEPEQLAPALAVALRAEGGQPDLSDSILADDRLLADEEQTERVVLSAASEMSKDQRGKLWERVIELYPESPEILEEPASGLPADVLKELVEVPALGAAIRERLNGLDADEAKEEIDELLRRMAERSGETEGVRGALLLRLLDQIGNGYDAVLRHRQEIAAFAARPGYRVVIALKAVRLGPPTDWTSWAALLKPVGKPWSDQPKRARDTALAIVTRWGEARDAGIESAATLAMATALVPTAGDAEFASAIAAPAQAAIGTGAWWSTEATATAQAQLHAALLDLQAIGPRTQAATSRLVAGDIERAVAPRPNLLSLTTVERVAGTLQTSELNHLAKTLAALPAQPAPILGGFGMARIAVAKAALAQGEDAQSLPYAVSADDTIAMLVSDRRLDALNGWFSLNPVTADGRKVALVLGAAAPASERRPVTTWAASLSPSERTDLLLAVSRQANDVSGWVSDISSEPIDEERFLRDLDGRIRGETRGEARAELARTIGTLRPLQAGAQHVVGKLVLWMLDQGKRVDIENSLILLPALGEHHRLGRELGASFTNAAGAGFTLSNRAAEDLRRAHVPFKKRSLPEAWWEKIRASRRGR